jgi:hypothetical protein
VRKDEGLLSYNRNFITKKKRKQKIKTGKPQRSEKFERTPEKEGVLHAKPGRPQESEEFPQGRGDSRILLVRLEKRPDFSMGVYS